MVCNCFNGCGSIKYSVGVVCPLIIEIKDICRLLDDLPMIVFLQQFRISSFGIMDLDGLDVMRIGSCFC